MMDEYMKQRFYRKNIAWMYLLVLMLATVAMTVIPKYESAQATDPLIIPDEAIRLRILANSDGEEDQEVKRMIRDTVNAEINEWVAELTSLEDARDVISSQLDTIEEMAKAELAEQGLDYAVKVEFGEAKFPTKLYGQFLYPAGTYEAIVITLGEGKGANWWCVLFPPLCFLDFSNSLAVSDTIVDEEDSVEIEEEEADDTVENEESSKPKEKASKKEKDSSANKERKEQQTEENDKDSETESQEDVDEESEAPIVVEEEEEVEVKFFLVDLFDKLFN